LITQRFIYPSDLTEPHTAAAHLYVRCRQRGITPRSAIDCLIAQIAIENQAYLLHNDGDFDQLARVAPELRIYDPTA
jgi:predicted nucleic acid-binding protein